MLALSSHRDGLPNPDAAKLSHPGCAGKERNWTKTKQPFHFWVKSRLDLDSLNLRQFRNGKVGAQWPFVVPIVRENFRLKSLTVPYVCNALPHFCRIIQILLCFWTTLKLIWQSTFLALANLSSCVLTLFTLPAKPSIFLAKNRQASLYTQTREESWQCYFYMCRSNSNILRMKQKNRTDQWRL